MKILGYSSYRGRLCATILGSKRSTYCPCTHRAFTGSSNHTLRTTLSGSHFDLFRPRLYHERKNATLDSTRQDLLQDLTEPDGEILQDGGETGELVSVEQRPAEGTDQEPEPWFMNVDLPSTDTVPLSRRQELPALPPDAPPLLAIALNHLRDEIGLDDLRLLDLRDLYPPASLGSNLIMILGTARSEKHLHVSAESFLRWLKREQNLQTYADGLLGRGELKKKLRRKNRRTKMLSRVGAKLPSYVDDGLSTGWICVHSVGIPDGRPPRDQPEDFVGFREEESGVTMIVQMLTQDKREELDLETLWTQVLQRSERREMRRTPHEHRRASSSSEAGVRSLPSLAQGARHYSTGARSCPQTSLDVNTDSSAGLGRLPPIRMRLQSQYFRRKYERGIWDLTSLPDDEARDLLKDPTSPYWQYFNWKFSVVGSMLAQDARMDVFCYGQKLGLDFKRQILEELRLMEARFVDLNPHTFTSAIKALLTPPIKKRDLTSALLAFERLLARGQIPHPREIRHLILKFVSAVNQSDPRWKLKETASRNLQMLSSRLISDDLSDEDIDVIKGSAKAGRWPDAWDTWRAFPSSGRPRAKEHYVVMLTCLAESGKTNIAASGLRRCMVDIDAEEPRVEIDAEIAWSIARCLLAVDPRVDARAREGDSDPDEWLRLWTACMRIIDEDYRHGEPEQI